jgi:hypothetical protein
MPLEWWVVAFIFVLVDGGGTCLHHVRPFSLSSLLVRASDLLNGGHDAFGIAQ